MKSPRPIGHWIAKGFAPPFQKAVLSSSGNIRDELLGSLDMYAEIKLIGKDLLKANGHADLSAAYLRFQAYIRQAKAFFEAAETLHHRASPLNYYYAFMNLAKGLIFLRTPTFVDHNLTHGITQKATKGSIRKQRIIIKKLGVFPLFYKLVTSRQMANNASLGVGDLLGYSSDVLFEYGQLKYGPIVTFPCKLAFTFSADKQRISTLIAIGGANHKEFKTIRKAIEKSFEQVNLALHATRDIFQITAEDTSSAVFFESKKEYVMPVTNSQITTDVVSSLSQFISYSPFNDDHLFVLNRPIRTPQLAPMQELIAIYCCMFFLGSLVRYRPELLEAMLTTKDAWLIEQFTKSAPITFLRHIRNLFDNKYLAYTQR